VFDIHGVFADDRRMMFDTAEEAKVWVATIARMTT
jgi:hypothetical protein